jgi:uncharacterized membrane protein
MVIEESIEIAAPRARVFEVFTDIPNAAEMLDGINSIEVLSDEGDFGEGFRWRETRTMFRKEATEEMWVTKFDAPASYTVEAESHGTHYRSVYAFEPADDNNESTWVDLTFEGRPVSTAAKLMSPFAVFFKSATSKAFRKDLAQLKAACEKD